MKILCIDDEAAILYALHELFCFQGWTPLLASGVREGLTLFDAEQPDIILIDYHMPRISGLDGVRMLRERDPAVPIIVFTIEEDPEVTERFMEYGATDFALKPIKAPDIINRIRLHVRLMELERKLTGSELAARPVILAKGIQNPTLELIKRFLREQQDYVTVEELASGTGLASQTVYRYLQYLVGEQKVEKISSYGKIGRPKQAYRYI